MAFQCLPFPCVVDQAANAYLFQGGANVAMLIKRASSVLDGSAQDAAQGSTQGGAQGSTHGVAQGGGAAGPVGPSPGRVVNLDVKPGDKSGDNYGERSVEGPATAIATNAARQAFGDLQVKQRGLGL